MSAFQQSKESGVDQLISRLKTEAVEEAKKDALEILAKARKEASEILAKAQKNAEAILKTAKIQREEDQKTLFCELSLAARDYLQNLKENVQVELSLPIIKRNVNQAVNSADFLKNMLTNISSKMITEDQGIEVILRSNEKEELASYFAHEIFKDLEQDLNKKLKNGFMLKKKTDGYLWDFSIDTITEELYRLIRVDLQKYFSKIKDTQNTGEVSSNRL